MNADTYISIPVNNSPINRHNIKYSAGQERYLAYSLAYNSVYLL